jgi:Flp pilus assembly protein TadG
MGQATVEFALVAIIFFTLLIGVIECGRLIYGIVAITNGAREGARYAIAESSGTGACNSTNAGLLQSVHASTQGLSVTVTATQGDNPSPDNPNDVYCQVEVDWTFLPAGGAFDLPSIPVKSTSRHYYFNNLQ